MGLGRPRNGSLPSGGRAAGARHEMKGVGGRAGRPVSVKLGEKEKVTGKGRGEHPEDLGGGLQHGERAHKSEVALMLES